MKPFKHKFPPGIHVLSLPISQTMTLDQLFPKELSGAYVERLDDQGNWCDKQIILYENNAFLVVSSYKKLSPLQSLRLTLTREMEINWQWEFISDSGLKHEEISIKACFDLSQALHFAQLSKLVYEDETYILNMLKNRYSFDESFYFSKVSHQGYFNRGIVKLLYTFMKGSKSIVDLQFTYSKKFDSTTGRQLIVVVFKGSEEPLDWMTNFSLKDTNFQNRGNVHKGFYHSLKLFLRILRNKKINVTPTIFVDIFDDIKRFNETSDIILTGHSLGGALATLTACYLFEMGIDKDNLSVYSFGSPPVGDKKFNEFYNQKLNIYRFVNEGDVIPKLNKISNLEHIGQEIILPSNNGEAHACEGYIDNIIDGIQQKHKNTHFSK